VTQRTRILIACAVLVVVAGAILGLDLVRRRRQAKALAPGSVPVYVEGRLVGGFAPDDLEQLQKVSFEDAEEAKTQEGWLLSAVLALHVPSSTLKPDTRIVVSSTSRDKQGELTWAEVENPANMVMFALSNRGTLKLVSKLEKLDTRNEWVQDVDRIEISRP
jgi:hypothetical protein